MATKKVRLLSLRASEEDRALLAKIAAADGVTEHACALGGLRAYILRRIGELEAAAKRETRKAAKRRLASRQAELFTGQAGEERST